MPSNQGLSECAAAFALCRLRQSEHRDPTRQTARQSRPASPESALGIDYAAMSATKNAPRWIKQLKMIGKWPQPKAAHVAA